MTAVIKRTKNYTLIARLDEKIFGEAESIDDPIEKSVWFLVVMDGKVAGFAGLTPFEEDGEKYGFLERSGLLPAFRGRGVQKQMIAVRDAEAKRLGLKMTFTYTAHDNCASSNSLIKMGYKLYNPYHRYSGLRGALYWQKKL